MTNFLVLDELYHLREVLHARTPACIEIGACVRDCKTVQHKLIHWYTIRMAFCGFYNIGFTLTPKHMDLLLNKPVDSLRATLWALTSLLEMHLMKPLVNQPLAGHYAFRALMHMSGPADARWLWSSHDRWTGGYVRTVLKAHLDEVIKDHFWNPVENMISTRELWFKLDRHVPDGGSAMVVCEDRLVSATGWAQVALRLAERRAIRHSALSFISDLELSILRFAGNFMDCHTRELFAIKGLMPGKPSIELFFETKLMTDHLQTRGVKRKHE
jgi:hypothetical protein